jgi:hypothetical protein
MTSIRHFPATHPLPDWRNFGVMLRVLLGVNVMALAAALVQAPALASWVARYVEMAALVEPLLLLALGLLAALRDRAAAPAAAPRATGGAAAGGGLAFARACSGSRWVSVTVARPCARRSWRSWHRRTARLFRAARPRLLAGPGRGTAGGAECAHPAALPVQLAECRAVADPRPAAAGRGGAGSPCPICSAPRCATPAN